MSVYLTAELVEIEAIDQEDYSWLLQGPDEIGIKGSVRITESNQELFADEFEIDNLISIPNGETRQISFVDNDILNDLMVPYNADIEIIMSAMEYDGDDENEGSFSVGVTTDVLNVGSTLPVFLPNTDNELGQYYSGRISVNDIELGNDNKRDIFFHGDDICNPCFSECACGRLPYSGWDYRITYNFIKRENDDLLGTEGKDTYTLGDKYVDAGGYHYAVMKDFDVENDVIRLEGNFSDYELENINSGTGIFHSSGNNRYLIGVISGVENSELSFDTNFEMFDTNFEMEDF